MKLKAPYSVNILRSILGPTDADIAKEFDEAIPMIEEKAKHVDCDCLACRPWTT